jgi:hypothetical protein
MAHPIFDRNSYAWERQEAKELFDVLVNSVPLVAEIAQLYAQAGGDQANLNTNQTPQLVWTEALNRLAEQEKLRTFCEVVLPGIQRFQSSPRFQAALKAVADAVPVVERKIIAGVPVVDRVPLRNLVDRLKSDALRVLLVRGGPKTGKTHGRHVFLAGAKDAGAKALYLPAAVIATVDDLVLELFGALDAFDEVPPRDTTDAAWYRTVCLRLGNVAGQRRVRLWVAIDDLGASSEDDGAPLIDQEVARFCGQFVMHMANPAFGDWFRLMLIHYPDGPVPTRWLQDVWREDRPTGTEGDQQDIVDYLRDWAAHQGGRAFPQGEAEALAADMIARVDSPPPEQAGLPRLQRLHDELAAILEARG